MTGRGERPRPRPPQRPGEAGGQHRRLRCGVGRQAALDNRAAVRRQRAGCGSKAERRRETEPVVEAARPVTGPETGGYGPLGCSVLVVAEGRLARPFSVRAGEAAYRVAVLRGDAAGVQLGADPADRSMSERGKRPRRCPADASGFGQAHRPPVPPGRGGGPVVVVAVTTHRGGRESRPQGEGVQ
jgi:hypothetical protein